MVKTTYLLLSSAQILGDLNLWVKITVVIVVEIQSCNFDLDQRAMYGLTKVRGKFEQTCLGTRRRCADPDLNFF